MTTGDRVRRQVANLRRLYGDNPPAGVRAVIERLETEATFVDIIEISVRGPGDGNPTRHRWWRRRS